MQYFLGFDFSKLSISARTLNSCEITIDGYTFAINTWGNLFYKVYEEMNYLDAKAQCESDGTYLATPRSDDQNGFIASLIPNLKRYQSIWIGLNDIDEEGTFVSVDGEEVSYTKWSSGAPHDQFWGDQLDGVQMMLSGNWTDISIKVQEPFVCTSHIFFDNSSK